MFGKKKRQTHKEMIAGLKELECNLEIKAASDYQENKGDVKNCVKCNIPPEHGYDSFGMPMHQLQCPMCHNFVTYAKSFEGVKEKWNMLQDGKLSEEEKTVFCSQTLKESADEMEIWQMNFDLAINRIRHEY